MRFVLCLIGVALASAAARTAEAGDNLRVQSPDGRVGVAFRLAEVRSRTGVPTYNVTFRGKTLIRDGRLGVDLQQGGPLRAGFRITGVSRTAHDETYHVFPGKNSQARDHYNEATVSLEEVPSPHRRMDLVFRAYDDGVAFRYRFPRQETLPDLIVNAEETTFPVTGNPLAHALPVGSYTTPYEFYYHNAPLQDQPADALIGLPLLLEYPDHTALAITEADLTDYAAMYVAQDPNAPGTLVSRLSPHPEDPRIKVKAKLPHPSPWRVLMIADHPGKLIESNLVLNLNPPCAIADTSWIRPGKTTFPWWNGFDMTGSDILGGLNTATEKYYIDFCAENGIPYHSLDGLDNIAWYGGTIVPYPGTDIVKGLPGLDLPELIRYAKEKGVRLRLWMHSGAAKAHMYQAFPLYEQWGIEGVMVDFVDKDDQETLNWEREMIALAAKHHLTVTFHNLSKPTGLSRTYPNLMTLEAVMNLEYDKWDPKGSTPEHELTIPFTRMLAGPVDYHSGSFRNVLASDFKPRNTAPVTIGTRARQLARYVVYEGYLPMAADSPGAYRGQLGLDALVQVPTTWDETRFLSGEVGKYAVIARRSGETWWVGAMTDSSARQVPLSLRFLGAGRYQAEIWADDPDAPNKPTHLLIRKLTVTAKDTLPADLAPAGGVLVKLAPL